MSEIRIIVIRGLDGDVNKSLDAVLQATTPRMYKEDVIKPKPGPLAVELPDEPKKLDAKAKQPGSLKDHVEEEQPLAGEEDQGAAWEQPLAGEEDQGAAWEEHLEDHADEELDESRKQAAFDSHSRPTIFTCSSCEFATSSRRGLAVHASYYHKKDAEYQTGIKGFLDVTHGLKNLKSSFNLAEAIQKGSMPAFLCEKEHVSNSAQSRSRSQIPMKCGSVASLLSEDYMW